MKLRRQHDADARVSKTDKLQERTETFGIKLSAVILNIFYIKIRIQICAINHFQLHSSILFSIARQHAYACTCRARYYYYFF